LLKMRPFTEELEGEAFVEAIDYASKLGCKYADVRAEVSESTSITVRRGQVEESRVARTRGAGVRVLINGAWGFSVAEDLAPQVLRRAVEEAFKMARASAIARRSEARLAEANVNTDAVKAGIGEWPEDVDPGEKLGRLLELDRIIASHGDVIKDSSLVYSDARVSKLFASSEGSFITLDYARTYVLAYVVAGEGGVLSPASEAMGGVRGYEAVRSLELDHMVEETALRAIRLLKADVPRGGMSTVVLDNKLLALIVHEAFGHAAEADLVLTGDVLTGRLGERVASEHVTIVDDPLPENANGWTPYDDEGVRGRRVAIVEDGMLKGYMHSRETAAKMGYDPTGNGRAQNYRFRPLVRMRNTYMLPRDWRPEEIIEETRRGLYLKGALGGQADANGDFMFSVQEAWLIEDGELKKPYRGVTVSGNSIEVLRSVDAVGNDLKIGFPGTCGKTQMVPVDGGGPHIRCRMIVGGSA